MKTPMKKITSYKIVIDDAHNIQAGFIRQVWELMKEGWQPLGGIAAVPTPERPPGDKSVCQVMVKYENEE